MKKMSCALSLMALVVGILILLDCTKNDDDNMKVTPPVTLGISSAETIDVALSVTITPSGAGDWYATVYPASDIQGKTDTELVSTHVANPQFASKLKKGTQTLTFQDLIPSTSYIVIAFGWNGKEAGAVARLQVTTKEKEKDPEKVQSNYFDVNYWGDVYHNGFYNWIIFLGDASHKDVTITSEGSIYTLSIYNKKAPGTDLLPEMGSYKMIPPESEDPEDHCIEQTESCQFIVTRFVSETDYTLKREILKNAVVNISKNDGDTYSISAVVELPDGSKKELVYTGKVNITDKSFKGYTGPTIDSNIDFVADYTAGYNYVGTGFEIMTGGDPNAEGASWFNRHRLTIYLAADKSTGTMCPPIGTFKVSREELPGSVWHGQYVDLGGGAEGPQGTYYFYWKKEDKKMYYAFVQSGSVTIAKGTNEGEYIVTCDFKTDRGYTIKASYTGTFPTTFASSTKAYKAPENPVQSMRLPH